MVNAQCYWVHHHTRCPEVATTTHHATPLCDTHNEWMIDTDHKLNKIIIGLALFAAIMIIIATAT